MTKEFETRIQKERELDTTAALTDWEIVKIYR